MKRPLILITDESILGEAWLRVRHWRRYRLAAQIRRMSEAELDERLAEVG